MAKSERQEKLEDLREKSREARMDNNVALIQLHKVNLK